MPRLPHGLPCAAGTFSEFQGFVALAIALRMQLRMRMRTVYIRTGIWCSGIPLWLAVPNAMAPAESLGLAGPPDVGDVPVEAPGAGRFQHRALAGAQATSTRRSCSSKVKCHYTTRLKEQKKSRQLKCGRARGIGHGKASSKLAVPVAYK